MAKTLPERASIKVARKPIFEVRRRPRSNLRLDKLAKRIEAGVIGADRCYLKACGYLVEAKNQVPEDHWKDWWKANLTIGETRINIMLRIGRAEDPGKELSLERAKETKRQSKSRHQIPQIKLDVARWAKSRKTPIQDVEFVAAKFNARTRRVAMPPSIIEYLETRGLHDDGGEISNIDRNLCLRLCNKSRKTMRHLDDAREVCVEAGYLDDTGNLVGGLATSTVADLIEAIRDDHAGRRVYAKADRAEADRINEQRKIENGPNSIKQQWGLELYEFFCEHRMWPEEYEPALLERAKELIDSHSAPEYDAGDAMKEARLEWEYGAGLSEFLRDSHKRVRDFSMADLARAFEIICQGKMDDFHDALRQARTEHGLLPPSADRIKSRHSQKRNGGHGSLSPTRSGVVTNA